ncbi:MAG: hypothetical protein JNJ94_12755 [Chlorobi bacterium]|nr:hypothetical protein [Chlorobiota bacterium]
MGTLFTLGYDEWDIEEIEAARIECDAGIMDIRWRQFSPRREFQLEELLKRWEGNYLEVPQLGNTAISGDPRICDLEKGMKILGQFLPTNNVILLCRCASLEQCHRGMIAEEARQRFGCEVIHLSPPKTVTPPTFQ